MPLSKVEIKRFRTIGHNLKPCVTIGANGLSEGMLAEIDRALEDHELIKVKVFAEDRDDRKAMIQATVEKSTSELVQTIGAMALIYRAAKKPKANLSNVLRNS